MIFIYIVLFFVIIVVIVGGRERMKQGKEEGGENLGDLGEGKEYDENILYEKIIQKVNK